MKIKIHKSFKVFIWEGNVQKLRLRWEVMLLSEHEGGTGIKDPIITLDAEILQAL